MGPRRGPSNNNNASWDELDTQRPRRTSDLSSLSGRNGTLPTIKSQKGFDPNDSPNNHNYAAQGSNGGLDHSNRSNYSNELQDNYHPERLPTHNNRNIKTNHSLRSNHSTVAGDGSAGRENGGPNYNNNGNGSAGWDELQDEIATAMAQSMAIGTGGGMSNSSGGDYNGITAPQQPDEQGNNEDGPWNCPACTFLNENPLHLVCAVCGTAKVINKAPKIQTNPNDSFTGGTGSIGFPPPRDYDGFNRSGSMGSFTGGGPNSYNNRRRESNAEELMGSFSSRGGRDRGDDYNYRGSMNSFRSSRRGSMANHSNGGGEYRGSSNSLASRDKYDRDSRDRDRDHRRRKSQRRGGHHRNSGRELLRSSQHSSIPDDDSFGSFDSQEDMHYRDYKNRDRDRDRDRDDSRGGGSSSRSRRNSDREDRKRYSQSVSGSSSRHRGGNDMDDMSRTSRRSQRSSRSKRDKKKKIDYRRSTSDVDRHGRGSGYRDYEDDYSDSGGPLGGKIRAGSGSDCSELSEPEELDNLSAEGTIYRDDKTARTMKTIKTMRVPEGDVTIIYTDVQGSTSLWEADPLAMKKSTDIHDAIIRKCYADHGGYEITTEGDAFNLAFQHPADAIGFALKAQLALYRAKWPEGILNHPDGCDNEKKKFRGFRVRFGMHHGPTTSNVHRTTGRTTYQGEAVNIAKAIEKMSHGGQILTTVDTWTAVSGMAEQFLGSPQVMDCGEHLLYDPKKENAGVTSKKKTKRIFSKRIVQLVPNSLSYDFFAARGGQEVKEGETPPRVCGRVFPPLLSHGQLSTSFLNAPYIGNKVAMVFVYTDKMESVTDKERKKNYKILAKYVRSHLMRLSPPGYECQEDKGSWMLAFDRIENGIKFGLDLKEDVLKNANLFGDVDKERAFRVGIHWGPFLSMGPHTVSGHADYFGPIVNRAARVAAQCEPGQVCVGVPMGDGEEPPDPGPSVDVDVLGVKQLKGISIEMAIFACKKRKEEKKSE